MNKLIYYISCLLLINNYVIFANNYKKIINIDKVDTFKIDTIAKVKKDTIKVDTISKVQEDINKTDSINNRKSLYTTYVKVVSYSPTKKQTGNTKGITANGTKLDINKIKAGKQRIVAISRDLVKYIPLGSEIYIEGLGNYIAADLTSPKHKKLIDICIHPKDKNFCYKNKKIELIKKYKK